VGQRHEVKDVADGYAINALFPQKAAEPATPEKIKQIETQKAAHDAELAKIEEQLTNKINSLRGKTVHVTSRATEKGGLFKALAAKDVAKAILAEHSLEVPEASIHFPMPVKTVGEHAVELAGKSTKASLTVVVAAA
jgi:large subunit ribosomal protein L9